MLSYFSIFKFIFAKKKLKSKMNGDNSDEGGRNRNWTEDLDCCQQTGCGYSINQIYLTDGRIKEGHVDFEKKLYCSYDSDK